MNFWRKFPSYQDYISAALGPSEMPESSRHSRTNSDEFSGASWLEAMAIATSGDIQGARDLSPAILRGANRMLANTKRFDPVHALDGYQQIDVARYLSGEPECWLNMIEREPAPRVGVDLIINGSVPSGVQANAYERSGVYIGECVLGLQAMGYPVTVHWAKKLGNHTNADTLVFCATLNPGGSMLDVSLLSAIIRPWFSRRIGFAFVETLDAQLRETFNIGGAYGRPMLLSPGDAYEIAGHNRAVTIDLRSYIQNPDGIKRLILDRLGQ